MGAEPQWGETFDIDCGVDRQPSDQQTMVKKQQMRWSQRGAHL